MSVERRDQQNLNLVTSASDTHRGVNVKYKDSLLAEHLSNRWTRIRLRARESEVIFNNLLHHINVETLCEAYRALDGSKALGIDGISKATYGKNLEENLVLFFKNGTEFANLVRHNQKEMTNEWPQKTT